MLIHRFLGSLIMIMAIILVGCTSAVYSPSMILPSEPLQKGNTQIISGFEYLIETEPERVDDNNIALGHEITLRHAICDHFSLQAKGWTDLSSNSSASRYGVSFGFTAILTDRPSTGRFGFIPNWAVVINDGSAEGWGGGMSIVYWYNRYKSFGLYCGITPAFGVKDLESETNKQWGYGLITNIGVAVKLGANGSLNFELSGVNQVNAYKDVSNFVVTPSLNIGYTFK